MDSLASDPRALADLIRRLFPPRPIPDYPPLLGLDPLGKEDEYAGFANVAWPEVAPENFRTHGYDIGPAIGFTSCPRMWNYYAPGFMTASLLHDAIHDVTDGFMWRMRDIEPPTTPANPSSAWWCGDSLFSNYSAAQIGCLVRYLQYIREFGGKEPHCYDWCVEDDRALERWLTRSRD